MPSEHPSDLKQPESNLVESNHQSFTISGSSLSGNVQLGSITGGDVIQAGGDVIQGGEQPALTAQDVVALLQEFEALLQSSTLSTEHKQKALTYLDTAKEEMQANEPEKEFVVKSFQKATNVLKEAGDTVEATATLWEKLEGIAAKMAPWFGVALKTLLLL